MFVSLNLIKANDKSCTPVCNFTMSRSKWWHLLTATQCGTLTLYQDLSKSWLAMMPTENKWIADNLNFGDLKSLNVVQLLEMLESGMNKIIFLTCQVLDIGLPLTSKEPLTHFLALSTVYQDLLDFTKDNNYNKLVINGSNKNS